MSPVEQAWVGAFIEADGYAGMVRHDAKYGKRYPRISVTQKDVEPISTLLRFTGTGGVHIQTAKGSLGKGPYFMWYVSQNAEALSLAAQCAPYSPKLAALLERSN